MSKIELINEVELTDEDIFEVIPQSSSEKILDAFDHQRARHFLDNLLIPAIRQSTSINNKQDRSCAPMSNYMVMAAHGAAIEDRDTKRNVN